MRHFGKYNSGKRWKNCKSPVKIWEAREKFWEARDGRNIWETGSGPKNLPIIVISGEMITLLESFCYYTFFDITKISPK